jgi:hypothetical protein
MMCSFGVYFFFFFGSASVKPTLAHTNQQFLHSFFLATGDAGSYGVSNPLGMPSGENRC